MNDEELLVLGAFEESSKSFVFQRMRFDEASNKEFFPKMEWIDDDRPNWFTMMPKHDVDVKVDISEVGK